MTETTKPTPVTIFITKDAIARGIRKARAVVIPQGLACLVDERGMALPNEPLLEPADFADTLDEAQSRVKQEIAKHIFFHSNRLAVLRALDLSTAVEG